ncbi:transmembrane protein [Mycolicibacterium phlei]|uniref:Membrane protein n=1 Tax=Mycolicibacterium phlei DSM 43239 = CCUG 21000 TaxID=1226750 RepID=A0A5N5VDG9_MYCPH|nr:hypothetical protein [Mycolicibacterium phlei]VEG11225.1 transmembrane protein [Mycobacteroides chelonae]AMO63128.1 putative membrane protein [Mycolicibacterium phlei]KAB7760001.1 membrane protein [Mycolicibacterium phlei DSM 43239 = CCUG 21000]KXW64373.1 hypothetical protein MPHL43072_07315 [Mycolicibacterium phlei DSM 43072]KXW69049.1 membrane protein [Mycolicibacterium phlei DSM 43239 = CCUG 21000]
MSPKPSATRRWLTVLAGRNPLVRRSDRWEAVSHIALTVTAVLLLSVAGAIGTAVYDGKSSDYAAERASRHQVAATIVDEPTSTSERNRLVFRAPVVWQHNGVAHTGTVEVAPSARSDDPVDIWVNDEGQPTLPPKPEWAASVDATMAGIGSWVGMVAGLAGLAGLIHTALARQRSRAWERELAYLVDGYGGRAGSQP